jgi:hypothetical protein
MAGKKGKKLFEFPDYILICFIVLFAVLLIMQYSSFKQLPSPVYGGDIYHQLGAVNHVKYGGNPFRSFTTLEGLPSYFPIYSLLVGGFARIFNASGISAMYIMSIILFCIGIAIVYTIFSKIFNKYTGLCAAMIFPGGTVFARGILKYTEFATLVAVPLFFLFLILFFQSKRKWIFAALSGIAYGIASLSHGESFFLITLILPLIFLYMLFFQFYDFKRFDFDAIKKGWKKNLALFMIIFIIGFAIAQAYWFKPISMALNGTRGVLAFSNDDIFSSGNFFWDGILNLFNFSSPFFGLLSTLFILGIILPFIIKGYDKKLIFIFIFSAYLILLPFHYVITEPLLGFSLVPVHTMGHAYPIAKALICSCAIFYLIKLFDAKKVRIFGIACFGLILAFLLIWYFTYLNTDTWVTAGRTELDSVLRYTSDWIKENTDVNDVFISTKEISSAMNALSGRKFVSLRKNHVERFLDFMQREADLAVMLYGNNSQKRAELFKAYNVKYLYWDGFWFQSEFIFNENGTAIDFYDPVLVFDTEFYRNYFIDNGVKFIAKKMQISASRRGDPNTKEHDLLVAIPANNDIEQPWDASLNNQMVLIKDFVYGNQSFAKVFAVKR